MLDAATILYGEPPAQEGQSTALTTDAMPEPASTPKASQPVADPNAPDNIKALRDADQGRKLYGAQGAYSGTLPADVLTGVESTDEGTKSAAVAVWNEIFYDLGVDVQDVNQFVLLAKQTRANPPDAKTIAEWQTEANRRLKERYGDSAGKALSAAKGLVFRDPRVAGMLDRTGIGNHPDVVLRFARLAQGQTAKQRSGGSGG